MRELVSSSNQRTASYLQMYNSSASFMWLFSKQGYIWGKELGNGLPYIQGRLLLSGVHDLPQTKVASHRMCLPSYNEMSPLL